MYRLSKQPLNIIIAEMRDFTPLRERVGVFEVVKKRFIDDIVLEEGDQLVLIKVLDQYVRFVPYDRFKEIKTKNWGDLAETNECIQLEITVEDFRNSFKVDTEETSKIEEYYLKVKSLYDIAISEDGKYIVSESEDYTLMGMLALTIGMLGANIMRFFY